MNVINAVISVLLFLILIGIYNLPNHVYKLLEESYRQKENRKLQIESYFRQVSGSKQEEVLSKWTNFLSDMENTVEKYTDKNPESQKLFRELIHDTLMYGSDETIKLIGNFKNGIGKTEDDQKSVVYMAAIICSLRKDFTGYDSNPLDLLKITILDYDDYEQLYAKYWNEIKKE